MHDVRDTDFQTNRTHEDNIGPTVAGNAAGTLDQVVCVESLIRNQNGVQRRQVTTNTVGHKADDLVFVQAHAKAEHQTTQSFLTIRAAYQSDFGESRSVLIDIRLVKYPNSVLLVVEVLVQERTTPVVETAVYVSVAVVEATEGVALEEENLRSLRLINHKTPLAIARIFDVAVNRTCKILQHFSHFLSLSDVEVHVEASVSSSTSVRNLFREILRGFEAVPLIESGPRL